MSCLHRSHQKIRAQLRYVFISSPTTFARQLSQKKKNASPYTSGWERGTLIIHLKMKTPRVHAHLLKELRGTCESLGFPGSKEGGDNGGSIVMGAHWNPQNTSKYITIHVYFDVFCVLQWAPITILPPLGGKGLVSGSLFVLSHRRGENMEVCNY